MTAAEPGPATPQPILTVHQLRKVFPVRGSRPHRDLVAVDDVSFSLERGGSLAIVGESGSGKSTIARMIVGLLRPTAGQITIADRDCSVPGRNSRERRRRGRIVQIVFQDPYTSLDRRQSVQDCLAEVIRLHTGRGSEAVRRRILELADVVQLDARQLRALPTALSGGQRQRVAIARALAAEPEVLILDEAVSALDVSIQAQVLNLLADIRETTAVSYLFISHDLAVVRQVSERAVVMSQGRVVEAGPTVAIMESPQETYTRRLLDSVPRPGWRPRRSAARTAVATADDAK